MRIYMIFFILETKLNLVHMGICYIQIHMIVKELPNRETSLHFFEAIAFYSKINLHYVIIREMHLRHSICQKTVIRGNILRQIRKITN